ncbi:unnamed protein product [Ilex paraguariensis]|uniref:OTU domain-containing protein n=1 Tax=Ilex paraguariensis TaxID=185542 RepID=A0ABC8SRQ7_9AQUA
MITYEQDPDVVRWGLQLFDGDPFSNCGCCGTVTQNDTDYYNEQYFKEDQYHMGCSNVEHDELLAHSLQDELSHLSVADAPGSSCEGVTHPQASFYPQEWVGQTMESYPFGQDNGHDEEEDIRPSSSCSSPEDKSYCGQEWSYTLELTDEYALDSEVGKRLNQMVPIPVRHVPRINGEIPSVDEATLDHQRLLDRLQLYELVEFKVLGDGNCQVVRRGWEELERGLSGGVTLRERELRERENRYVRERRYTREGEEMSKRVLSLAVVGYGSTTAEKVCCVLAESEAMGVGQFRALSDQFYRTPEHHKFVRQEIVNQLKAYPEIYEAYVPMAYGDYLKKISKVGEWGDHVTLQAAADSYGVKIFVITSFKNTCYIEILPNVQRSTRVIHLSFWAEVHYNSIYPEGDVPLFETKKKKKRWLASRDEHLE